ncbi:MAG: cold-shock DNA-binding protein family, partial [Alphaproteobacteria bacterium]|jgi:CspA family cold shock protein|nr:cold-shock DNA-binding protein family [Alphaproteobacteria bacterium]
MRNGIVKWFSKKKKFGFVVDEISKKDIFIHLEKLKESKIEEISEGQLLAYEIGPASRGREQAINIKVLTKKKFKPTSKKRKVSLSKVKTSGSIMNQIKEGRFVQLQNETVGYVIDVSHKTFSLLVDLKEKKPKVVKYNYLGWKIGKKGAFDSPFSVKRKLKSQISSKNIPAIASIQDGKIRNSVQYDEHIQYLIKIGLFGSNENGTYISDLVCAWETITK